MKGIAHFLGFCYLLGLSLRLSQGRKGGFSYPSHTNLEADTGYE